VECVIHAILILYYKHVYLVLAKHSAHNAIQNTSYKMGFAKAA